MPAIGREASGGRGSVWQTWIAAAAVEGRKISGTRDLRARSIPVDRRLYDQTAERIESFQRSERGKQRLPRTMAEHRRREQCRNRGHGTERLTKRTLRMVVLRTARQRIGRGVRVGGRTLARGAARTDAFARGTRSPRAAATCAAVRGRNTRAAARLPRHRSGCAMGTLRLPGGLCFLRGRRGMATATTGHQRRSLCRHKYGGQPHESLRRDGIDKSHPGFPERSPEPARSLQTAGSLP